MTDFKDTHRSISRRHQQFTATAAYMNTVYNQTRKRTLRSQCNLSLRVPDSDAQDAERSSLTAPRHETIHPLSPGRPNAPVSLQDTRV